MFVQRLDHSCLSNSNRSSAKIQTMRRWFTILLLLCTPLQFSLAAVSAYCGHEADSAAQHGKHHEHKHEHMAEAAHYDGNAPEAIGHIEADSAGCHSIGTTAIFESMHLPPVIASPCMIRIGYAMRVLPPPPPSPPERPKWTALA